MLEIGVIKAHPIKIMVLSVKSIYKTWRHAKKLGMPFDEWYGVYEEGEETCIASMGCTSLSEHYARLLAEAGNDFKKRSQACGYE